MPFTSQIIDASPTRKTLHLSFIDSDGKERTDSYDVPVAATDAELNTLAQEIGERSNAALWRVGVTSSFAATANPVKADAVNAVNDSVADNVAILMKALPNLGFDVFIPANSEAATMVSGTENPSAILLADLVAAMDAVWPTYTVASYRFTERRKKNRSTKA